MDPLSARLDKMMCLMAKERAQRLAMEETLWQKQAHLDDGIGLHAFTYPEHFPNDPSKVFFAILFMKDDAATWSQPFLTNVFNREPVVFSEFINDFKSSFFDHNSHHRTKVALRNLRQTSTVLTYTQGFNSHARTVGWADALLMSLCQHGIKENIQLAVVMSNIEFDSLRSMDAIALKAN
ncbi:uncharacterized protein VP01_3469g1 [Puccinia sorghi]|uniref:Retrotransposon gag domain-containing protein n=1 Tax=Puccinia sorghi TaxID=27349 RepID=A0A0L6UW54_9BASI|nr:uncharacterized protein VP01_3469g1 [Puccinia sorghi]